MDVLIPVIAIRTVKSVTKVEKKRPLEGRFLLENKFLLRITDKH